MSEENRRNQSKAQKKIKHRKHTEKEKERMKEIAKEKGYGKWMVGKKKSIESIEKLKKSLSNPEVRKKMREYRQLGIKD